MKKLILVLILVMSVTITSYTQWQPDVRLTNDPAVSSTSWNNAWCIASSGNDIHVVWYDRRDGNDEIYYKRSTDAGVSWGSDTRLTNNTAVSWLPSVAVSGSVVHVVWEDKRDENKEIYYKRSPDGGLSWGADTLLTNNTAASWYPSVAVSGSVVHVVWMDERDGNWEIYYKRSTDGGLSWGSDTRLTNNTAGSWLPSVAVSGLTVHVVWFDERDGNYEIYYKLSTDGGLSWGSDTRLTNNTAYSQFPSVAVSGLTVHVVWTETRDGNPEIYYKHSTDGGITWGADTRLTNNTAVSEFPSVAVSGSAVYVVWRDDRDGNPEIYYKHSTDGGITWGADTRLTNNTAYLWYPSVAVSGSAVYVVWYDERDGNPEIYYKRDPTGNQNLPNAPSNLTALAVSSSRINLNWTDNSNDETGFKIERSTNAGTNWILKDSVVQNILTYADTGLTTNTIYHYRLYAYNMSGNSPYSNIAFDTTFDPVGIITLEEIPKVFKLYNNYPNPFNPSTNIKFNIAKLSDVKIVVYDVMGHEVQTLVNESLKPGMYETLFDGSSLNGGVYFYKISAGDFSETKRMLLIK
jgi:hypothetical protein